MLLLQNIHNVKLWNNERKLKGQLTTYMRDKFSKFPNSIFYGILINQLSNKKTNVNAILRLDWHDILFWTFVFLWFVIKILFIIYDLYIVKTSILEVFELDTRESQNFNMIQYMFAPP